RRILWINNKGGKSMTARRLFSGLVLLVLLGVAVSADEKKDGKKDKKEPPKKKGTVVGKVTAKDKNWVEVKADGEAKARRYFPHWRGGAPAAGGGLDKKTLAAIAKIKVGSRVRIEWVFAERLRVEKIEVLKAAPEKDKKVEKDKKKEDK